MHGAIPRGGDKYTDNTILKVHKEYQVKTGLWHGLMQPGYKRVKLLEKVTRNIKITHFNYQHLNN
jgi:hypothetical protein